MGEPVGREPSVPTVSASVLSPLPPRLGWSGAGVIRCPTSRDGEPSIGYTVISGDAGQFGGLLHQHLRSLGFSVEDSGEKWHGLVARAATSSW